jgi:hypothetical protein
MSDQLQFRFRSRAIRWCRYELLARELDVCFVNGTVYRYRQVPRSVVDGLVTASSAGRYFNMFIVGSFSAAFLGCQETPPKRSSGTAESLLDRSMESVKPYLPEHWLDPVRLLLQGTPILIEVKPCRRSKRGDHCTSLSQGFSKITINATKNPWQFVLTLLHEIAHAHVAHSDAPQTTPHGPVWKREFGDLLRSHLALFPNDLIPCISRHSNNPLYSTDADALLTGVLQMHER